MVTVVLYRDDESCPRSHGRNLNQIYLTPELIFFPLRYCVYHHHHHHLITITKVISTNCRQFEKKQEELTFTHNPL